VNDSLLNSKQNWMVTQWQYQRRGSSQSGYVKGRVVVRLIHQQVGKNGLTTRAAPCDDEDDDDHDNEQGDICFAVGLTGTVKAVIMTVMGMRVRTKWA
jgi:hypothetical protein